MTEWNDDFEHVKSALVRRVLTSENPPRKDLRHALLVTLQALGSDVCDPRVAGSELAKRIEAATEASDRLMQKRFIECRDALRRFWGAKP